MGPIPSYNAKAILLAVASFIEGLSVSVLFQILVGGLLDVEYREYAIGSQTLAKFVASAVVNSFLLETKLSHLEQKG